MKYTVLPKKAQSKDEAEDVTVKSFLHASEISKVVLQSTLQ